MAVLTWPRAALVSGRWTVALPFLLFALTGPGCAMEVADGGETVSAVGAHAGFLGAGVISVPSWCHRAADGWFGCVEGDLFDEVEARALRTPTLAEACLHMEREGQAIELAAGSALAFCEAGPPVQHGHCETVAASVRVTAHATVPRGDIPVGTVWRAECLFEATATAERAP